MALGIKPITGWSTGTKIAVGTGTLLAVAVAVYLLTGKRGERNRAKLRQLGRTMGQGVMSGLHTLENLNQHAKVPRRKTSLKVA